MIIKQITLDISTKILEISRQWSNAIKILKEKHFQLKEFYLCILSQDITGGELLQNE